MLIKGITDEDFVNYKVPSMFIATATCSFKCDKEYGSAICQNSALVKQPDIEISAEDIVKRYLSNPITKAIVFGGLEPTDQLDDILHVIASLRMWFTGYDYYDGLPTDPHPKSCDDIVIYTGYTKQEFGNIFLRVLNNNLVYGDPGLDLISPYLDNPLRAVIDYDIYPLVIKFGRYIPGHQPHYDPVLGVYLASDNQYAERIS